MYEREHGYHLHWRPDVVALNKILIDDKEDDYGTHHIKFEQIPAVCHAYRFTEFPGTVVKKGSSHFQV